MKEWIPESWRGSQDLSGRVRWAWDDEALCSAADVRDDLHLTRADVPSYAGDSVQLWFDTKNNTTPERPAHDTGDYVCDFWLLDTQPRALRGICPPFEITSFRSGDVPANALPRATRRVDDHTFYEIRMPWSQLAPFKPHPNATLRFSVLINDSDGEGRKCALGLTPVGTEPFQRADLFSDLIFLGNGGAG